MRILHLTLKKKWFNMILLGKKWEEYREIKPYWDKRIKGKRYDAISFRNGYSKDAPTMLVEFIDHHIGLGVIPFGAPSNQRVHILTLGKILETKNVKEAA